MSLLSLRSVCRALAVLALVFAISSDAAAQITAATINGSIKDDTSGVLPGVTVTVTNTKTGLSRTVTTDDGGLFTVPGLPPGEYEIKATLEGFATAVEKLTLAVAQQIGMNLAMKVGTTEESITVVGTSTLVDTQNAALSAVVTEDTIEQLPLNGRNYIDLALLQPGVASFHEKSSTASSNRGTKMNINGMSFRSNSYLLDGANMRGYAGTATVSAAETTLGVETISEFRVVTNTFSADYGRAMGGVISLVTKGGTNEFHGSAFEFLRNSALDARNFFDRGDPPPFTRHQFGGAGGGPIVRNKLFFFGGIERLQEDLGVTRSPTVPSAAARSGALFPIDPAVLPYLALWPESNGRDLGSGVAEYIYESNDPTRENFYQGRVDYTISDKDTLFARYTYDGADQTVPVEYIEFGTNSVSRNSFLTIEHKRILTSTLLNTLRVSNSRLRFEQLPYGPSLPNLAFVPGQDLIGVVTVPGWNNIGGTTTNPSTNNSYYWTISDDVSYAKGKHLLKTGVLLERLRTSKLVATNTRGSYQFPSIQRFFQASPSRFVGVPPGAELNRERVNWLIGAYVQDDYRWTDRVTLNLGMRYEMFTIPSEINGLDTALIDIVNDRQFTEGALFAKNPSLKNFAPRLGFAWDVGGNGRTAVRGGLGMYHDTDGAFNSAFGIAAFSPPFASNLTINSPTFPVPLITGGPGQPSPRSLDYNIKQPYGLTYNINLQRELPGNMVMTVGYAGSRAYDLMSAIEGNPAIPVIQADGTKFFPVTIVRRNPAFGAIDYRTNGGRSRYHSFQAMAQKRFSNNYQFQVTYTLGNARDNLQAQLGADVNNSSVFPQDPYDREIDWTVTDFDIRHVMTTNFVWELPGPESYVLLGGWQLNGILTMRTGVPFTVSLNENWSRSGNQAGEDRPNLAPGVDPDDIIIGSPDRWFDPNAFQLQPAGLLGNAGRNSLRGPGYAVVNASLVKNTRVPFLGNAGAVQVRLEVFNLLNRANFATPTRTVFAASTSGDTPLPSAGRISRTVTSARQMQIGVKLLF